MDASGEKRARAIFKRFLADIKPTKEELKRSVFQINEVTGRLRRVVPKDVEIRVAGSIVRGTNLRGSSDIDVFLLFNKKVPKSKIQTDGLRYAKSLVTDKADRWEIKYAEHPYTRLYLNSLGLEADIVPAYKISSADEIATSVDRSPMHAEFMNEHLSEAQRDDVRLLKYFLARHGIYGAEVAIGGFSGYLCELLVYHYGSLLDLMNAVPKLKLPVALMPSKKDTISDAAIAKKFNKQFVVIDPVDPDRNVAAAVSSEALARFASISALFTDNPKPEMFYGPRFSGVKSQSLLNAFVRDSGMDMFALVTKVPDKSEDIVWPQLRKVADLVKEYIERFGFGVMLSIPVIKGRDGIIVFVAQKQELKARLIKGPTAFLPNAQKEFIKKHRDALGITFSEDRLYALEKNKYPGIEDALRAVASGKLRKRHKDIAIEGAKLFVNRVPKQYAETVYGELLKKLSV